MPCLQEYHLSARPGSRSNATLPNSASPPAVTSRSASRSFVLLLVLSGVIISVCMGLRQSLGLFMRPMTLDFGISAATFGFAIAVQNIVWGLSQPFVGALADRHGPRPVLIGTALLYAAGLLLMTVADRFPGGLQVAGFLAGVGTAGTGFGVLIGTVSRATPVEMRSRTVGILAVDPSSPYSGGALLGDRIRME